MPRDVAQFCQSSADEFISGDLGAMAARHALPLAVYMPDRLRISLTQEDLVLALGRRRAMAIDAGTVRVRVTALVIDAMNDLRLPLLVEWRFIASDGRQIARNRMRHYCRRGPGGGLLVEMVEILWLGFPGLAGPHWPPPSGQDDADAEDRDPSLHARDGDGPSRPRSGPGPLRPRRDR